MTADEAWRKVGGYSDRNHNHYQCPLRIPAVSHLDPEHWFVLVQ